MNNLFDLRKYIIAGIFTITCFSFVARLFYMQIIDDQYKLDASNETFRHVTQYPPTGLYKGQEW